MAAQAQLISTPLPLPPPPIALPTPPPPHPLPRTRERGAAGQLTLLIRKGGGRDWRGRGDQPGRRGRRGSSTRAEEESVQRKTS